MVKTLQHIIFACRTEQGHVGGNIHQATNVLSRATVENQLLQFQLEGAAGAVVRTAGQLQVVSTHNGRFSSCYAQLAHHSGVVIGGGGSCQQQTTIQKDMATDRAHNVATAAGVIRRVQVQCCSALNYSRTADRKCFICCKNNLALTDCKGIPLVTFCTQHQRSCTGFLQLVYLDTAMQRRVCSRTNQNSAALCTHQQAAGLRIYLTEGLQGICNIQHTGILHRHRRSIRQGIICHQPQGDTAAVSLLVSHDAYRTIHRFCVSQNHCAPGISLGIDDDIMPGSKVGTHSKGDSFHHAEPVGLPLSYCDIAGIPRINRSPQS